MQTSLFEFCGSPAGPIYLANIEGGLYGQCLLDVMMMIMTSICTLDSTSVQTDNKFILKRFRSSIFKSVLKNVLLVMYFGFHEFIISFICLLFAVLVRDNRQQVNTCMYKVKKRNNQLTVLSHIYNYTFKPVFIHVLTFFLTLLLCCK